jgi:tocopherol O-methyltransferase
MAPEARRPTPEVTPCAPPEDLSRLDDEQLVRRISLDGPVDERITDEYYRRVIPFFQRRLGLHWHTGLYTDTTTPPGEIHQSRMVDLIADSIGLEEGERVLDVGCGIGGAVIWLAGTRGVQATGLTPVSEQIRIAEALIETANVRDSARVVRGHADRLPFPDESFDAVIFFESPCHFTDRRKFFQEAFRILRPGGRLAGEDWLSREGLDAAARQHLIAPIHRTFSIRSLGSGESYVDQITDAGFDCGGWVDLRDESHLTRGFMVERPQQVRLMQEMTACRNPLEQLLLEGLLRLGQAVAADAFTIGRFMAIKPVRARQ